MCFFLKLVIDIVILIKNLMYGINNLWDEIIILRFMGFKSYLGRVLESLCNYRKMYD